MKISNLHLENIGCFDRMDLNFAPDMNIICGGNGVGKSTLLLAIATVFGASNNDNIFKSVTSEVDGEISYTISSEGKQHSHSIQISRSHPAEARQIAGNMQTLLARDLIHIKADRDFVYRPLQTITRDPQKKDANFAQEAWGGLKNDDLKNWLAQRVLFSTQKDSLTEIQRKDLDFVLSRFSLLGDDVSFKTVRADTYDVILSTPDGDVPFEMMSSGYCSVFYTVMGIVKELEYRRFERPASEFSGIILIDEVDLHLHPTWQSQIVESLRASFSKAQFIVTTHSPHVVQNAKPKELIALSRSVNGKPRKSELLSPVYGYAGWSVEEILEDVMGLPSSRSISYRRAMQEFNEALDADDSGRVKEALQPLMEMLHPDNVTRKILRLQAGPYLGGDE